MPDTRARTRVLPLTTFAGTPSVVTYDEDVSNATQIMLCMTHDEGTSATALTCDISVLVDVSTTDGQELASLYTTDQTFPYPEEVVGSTTSGVTTIDSNQSLRNIPSDLLDGNFTLLVPVIAGLRKLRFTFTETATAAGTLKGFIMYDYT